MIPGDESPQEDPEPIGPGFAFFVTMVVAFTLVFVVATVIALSPGNVFGAVGIGTVVAFGIGIALTAPRIPPPPSITLGFFNASRTLWTGAILLVPSMLLASELDNWIRPLFPEVPENEGMGPPESWLTVIEYGLVFVVALPVMQELFFRGALQPSLVRATSRVRGILLTAALNVLAFPTVGVAVVFCQAIVLGILRGSGRSLWPCFAVHMLFGVATVGGLADFWNIPGFDDLSVPHTPFEYLAPAALLTGIGLRLVIHEKPEDTLTSFDHETP